MSDKKKQTRTSVRPSSDASCSSSDTSPNILSRPKRIVSKRSLDASDFLTSHEEERQLAKALKESLKELKKNSESSSAKIIVPEVPKDIPTSSHPSKHPQPSPATARPKRDAAQRASVITDLLCLKSKEERELRKAIELSKRSILEDKRKREESSSIVSPSSPVTDLSAAASTSSASNINPASRRKEDDTKSQISDISSMDEMILKKPKIPPQRKFAQNSIPPQSMHSSSCTSIKQSSAQSTVHNKSVQLKEVFAAITPSTEDFLTFLCFRNGPALPHKVDLFSMNEKAIQEKRLQSPKNAASVASQTKSPSPLKQDVSKLSNGVTNNKNVDSRRSSATSSSYSSNPFHGAKPPRKSNVKLAIKSESHSVNDKPVKRAKKAVVPDKRVKKSKRTSMPGSESVSKEDAKVDTTPTKRITRSTSSTSYAESTSSIVPPVISVQELKEQQEKRLKEQMIAIEKQHQVRRRLSSDSSLHSSDSSSSESLPSTSSSASINISRVTRSIETLKQLRVIGQQSKLKGGHNSQTRRFARGQVASKAILQKAKRNLNSKSCSNGKLSDKSQQ